MATAAGYVRGALVQGASAHVLDRVLASPNVVAVLRSLPSWMGPELDETRRAIRRAAREYEARAVAVDGSAETEVPEVGASSGHEVTTGEAAVLLGCTERRVRQLAAGGMGARRGGRWVLDRSVVLAYAERRRTA
ncbi:helix-turn-helix domain-containing protein [Streptomyces smaragdinus]|uniref:helix-turn-helix domain-containing protein n=1 Tax=Streptomyces smaragdinus TaxID=2585196 RepID=UPI001296CD3C|nr:helix-turn-helix domain-containing protein [Streptomyces smaragdinus]